MIWINLIGTQTQQRTISHERWIYLRDLLNGLESVFMKQIYWIHMYVHLWWHYMTSQWARWGLKSPASRLFSQSFIPAQINEYIKAPCHWLCAGNSLVTGEFPAQMASNAENVSIWWHHHGHIGTWSSDTRLWIPYSKHISTCSVVSSNKGQQKTAINNNMLLRIGQQN